MSEKSIALGLIKMIKILKLDLNSGLQKTLFLAKGETAPLPLLSDWIKNFRKNGLVHPDYIDALEHLFDFNYLKKTLKSRNKVSFRYRRLSNNLSDTYRWTYAMASLDDKGDCYINVMDIDDD